MWNINKMTAIIWVTETMSQSFKIYLSNTPGKQGLKELEKTATLGKVYILRNVLMQKHKTLNMGNNITCTINGKCRIAATLYTL
jgi:hypothetical protein